MSTIKTSRTDPIRADWLPSSLPGKVGMTIAPGKHAVAKDGHIWARDLSLDLDRLAQHFHAAVLCCLLEEHELRRLQISPLRQAARARGMLLEELPIPNRGVLPELGPVIALVDAIQAHVTAGRNVVVHCAGGLGRTGTVCGCWLVLQGMSAAEAIATLHEVRGPRSPETREQEDFIGRYEAWRKAHPPVLEPPAAGRYQQPLALAAELAREAGALLLAEFTRAGGPRAPGDGSPLDAAVADLLGARLRDAFPSHGLTLRGRAPEPGAPADPELHHWLVDPHDGAASFLRGGRGSAVSLALLRQGRPVLGVVYAFAAGGAEGDLMQWAEGHALLRNARPAPRAWGQTLGSEHTALLDERDGPGVEQLTRRAFPARFRTVPSLAYRLALVASGEGDVAVSFDRSDPCAHAAGHALLLGAGADLFDAHGKPVVYPSDANGPGGRLCVGGAREQVAAFLAGPGPRQLTLQAPGELPPWGGRVFADRRLLDRALGCLLGQCAGDALGSLVEFRSASSIASQYPDGPRRLVDGGTWNTLAGQPTDDTEMALALARSLVEKGGWNDVAAASSYARWLGSHPFDMGNTTRQAFAPALRALESGADPAEAARQQASRSSAANGALMRISPLAVHGHALDPAALASQARGDAELSHPDPRCQGANVVFVAALVAGLHGASPAEMFAAALASGAAERVDDAVLGALRAAPHALPADFTSQMGYVLIALQNAFYELLHAPSVEDGLVATVRRGGDTDTNGAIAGALLGASRGAAAFPASWRDRVLSCRPLAGLPGVAHPRPRTFWPTDLPELAEALLITGGDAAGQTPLA